MSKRPVLTLVYFNIRGRAEIIRLLMHAAGVKFEDHRVEFSEWPDTKDSTPGGTLPYIVYQGQQFGEAMPLTRFLARKYKMMGKTELEQLEADVILHHIDQLRTEGARLTTDSILNDAQRKDMNQKFEEETVPAFLHKMSQRLEYCQFGFLIGQTATVADLALFDMTETLEREFPGVTEKYPLIADHYRTVGELPRISAYLAQRPHTKI